MNRRNQTTPYPEATPLGTLVTPELVLVTTLRLWLTAACGTAGRNTCPLWYGGLATAGVSEKGSMAFHGLMEAILLAANGPLDFRPMKCRLLGRDEGRMLQTIGLLQHNRKKEAASAFADWIPPAGRRLAGTRALILAEELSLAGLTIPLRGEITTVRVISIRHPGPITAQATALLH